MQLLFRMSHYIYHMFMWFFEMTKKPKHMGEREP